ncbi:MAG: protein phosphatase 2C domain-containing protein [Defluviitaleaceae bacterium]|nr:protein phosphatase 2C domain-containing protein [Defluviitaleaceae bacterium]
MCQDYHKIEHCGEDMAIAVVADGLGSAEFADYGSRIAATTAAEYCKKQIDPSGKEILEIIKGSFVAAYDAVEQEAKEKERGTENYDTTLTLAVLFRDDLYYGHSGDSGIIALTAEGRYEAVTSQQRDEDGRVFPLHFKNKWKFAKYKHKVSAVLLATDGMLETFFPFYIRNAEVKIHVSLVQFFMCKHSMMLEELGQDMIKTRITNFMENIPNEQVSDDKTVTVLINASIATKEQPEEYYMEPDWAELKKKHDEEWKREAYPEMFVVKKTTPETPAEIKEEIFPEDIEFMPKRKKPESRKNVKIIVAVVIILCVAAVALGLFLFYFS